MNPHDPEKVYTFDSDSEDADYVPQDEENSDSETDFTTQEAEDSDSVEKTNSNGKRKKSTRLNPISENNTKRPRIQETSNDEKISHRDQKSNIDALWAEFNREPKTSADTLSSSSLSSPSKDDSYTTKKEMTTNMITITKTFRFAGEEITETREVDADSEEAKRFLLEQEKKHSIDHSKQQETLSSSSSDIKTDNDDTKEQLNNSINNLKKSSSTPTSLSSTSNQSQSRKASLIASYNSKKPIRPKSNLDQLAASFKNKPTKINTLDKSKMDWNKFVYKEGIADELKYHNKSGQVL
ncbi:8979_t:CDS:2 [Ambispora leptoticha]|uniref:SWR1-complex protein 5 n=1 Tax=Ambispora leptoticha TaxID=144679 RepID=A0A9N9GRQ3_9GLOM|nr:8979_t:CDS:2 [Ambispora leptoticha]